MTPALHTASVALALAGASLTVASAHATPSRAAVLSAVGGWLVVGAVACLAVALTAGA